MSIFVILLAGIMISFVMLGSRLFGKVAAYAGILGFSILLVIEYFSSFTGLSEVMMMLFMLGGVFSMVWYILIAVRLFALGRNDAQA